MNVLLLQRTSENEESKTNRSEKSQEDDARKDEDDGWIRSAALALEKREAGERSEGVFCY